MAPDGRIAILDSVNSRLVVLDRDGTFLRPIPVDLSEPRFLAVTDDALYVLDSDADGRLCSFDWNGSPLDSSDLPALDEVVTGLFATDRGSCIEIAHDRTLLVTRASTLAAAASGFGAATKAGPLKLRSMTGRPIGSGLGRTAGFRSGRAQRPASSSTKWTRTRSRPHAPPTSLPASVALGRSTTWYRSTETAGEAS